MIFIFLHVRHKLHIFGTVAKMLMKCWNLIYIALITSGEDMTSPMCNWRLRRWMLIKIKIIFFNGFQRLIRAKLALRLKSPFELFNPDNIQSNTFASNVSVWVSKTPRCLFRSGCKFFLCHFFGPVIILGQGGSIFFVFFVFQYWYKPQGKLTG